MADLTQQQKYWIVQKYAQFWGTGRICREFEEAYHQPIPAPIAKSYDAASKSFRASKRWIHVWKKERGRFLTSIERVGASHRVFRIEMLHDMAVRAHAKGNFPLAAAMLKQAAQDLGGVFDKPVVFHQTNVQVNYADKTTEELRAEIIAECRELGISAEMMGFGPPQLIEHQPAEQTERSNDTPNAQPA